MTLGGENALDPVRDFADRMAARAGRNLSDRSVRMAAVGCCHNRADSAARYRQTARSLTYSQLEALEAQQRTEDRRVTLGEKNALADLLYPARAVGVGIDRDIHHWSVAAPFTGARRDRVDHPTGNRSK